MYTLTDSTQIACHGDFPTISRAIEYAKSVQHLGLCLTFQIGHKVGDAFTVAYDSTVDQAIHIDTHEKLVAEFGEPDPNGFFEELYHTALQTTPPVRIYNIPVETADVPNHNGRIYPKHVLQKIVDTTRNQCAEQMLFGQISSESTSVIKFDQISHRIADISMKDDKLVADIDILLNLQNGRVLHTLYAQNLVEFRLHGIGNIENNVIQDDYKLASISAKQKIKTKS